MKKLENTTIYREFSQIFIVRHTHIYDKKARQAKIISSTLSGIKE